MEQQVLTGTVTRLDTNTAWVEIPALGPGMEFGPCEVVAEFSILAVGTRVAVAALEGMTEDYIVLGSLDGDTTIPVPVQWLSGSGAPSNANGNNNDWYLNIDNGDLYQKVAGAWSYKMDIAAFQWKGAWNSATAYIVGDVVTDSNSTFRRKVAGTTATAPGSDATNWEPLALGGTGPSGSAIYYGDVNLFANPGFESLGAQTTHDNQVSGWHAFWRSYTAFLTPNQASMETDASAWAAGANTPTLASSTAQAHAGTKSILVTWGTFGAGSAITTTVTGLVVGKQYTLTGWVYRVSGPAVSLQVAGTGSPNNVNSGAWEKLTVTFNATATSQVIALMSMGPTTAGQQVYLDDLALVPVRDSEFVAVVDAANVYAGSRSARITIPGEMPAGYNQTIDPLSVIPVTAGEIVTVRIKAKVTSGAPTIQCRFVVAPASGNPDFFGTSNTFIDGTTYTPTSGWVEYVWSFAIPSGSTQARATFAINKPAVASATDAVMWLDDGAIYREAASQGNSIAPSVRNALTLARHVAMGGGLRSYSRAVANTPETVAGIKWTSPIRVENMGRSAQMYPDGYQLITMPADGVNIPGYGGAPGTTTVSGGRIPLANGCTLYYNLTPGTPNGTDNTRFFIASNTLDYEATQYAFPICTRDDNDIECIRWWDGKSESGWHYVGRAGEPAFQSSWVNYQDPWVAPGIWLPARFCRRNGITHIEGLVKGGTAGVIFTIPAGYRPGSGTSDAILFPADSGGSHGRLDVTGAGSVFAQTVPSNGYFGINVSYPAEQ